MALSAISTVKWRPRGGVDDRQSFKVIDGDIIYHGALVVLERDTGTGHGYLKPLASASGVSDLFCGVAHPTGVNAEYVTGDSDGSPVPECDVDISGVTLIYKAVTGASAITDTGRSVFATDDTVLTLTDPSNMYPIGRIVRWYTGTYCDVKLYSMMEYAAMVDADLY